MCPSRPRSQAAIAQVDRRFGRLDALVNNAGIAVFKPILETTVEDWTRVLATNLTGPFLCTQACAPLMLRSGGGSVVNIASISGVRASTLRVAYGTSKAALIHLTKQQAVELGNAGIRVNCVAPGPVETAMAQQVHSADIRTSYREAIPLTIVTAGAIGTARWTRSPTPSCSCAARPQASSMARCWRSTAGSTRRVSGCRACGAASDSTCARLAADASKSGDPSTTRDMPFGTLQPPLRNWRYHSVALRP